MRNDWHTKLIKEIIHVIAPDDKSQQLILSKIDDYFTVVFTKNLDEKLGWETKKRIYSEKKTNPTEIYQLLSEEEKKIYQQAYMQAIEKTVTVLINATKSQVTEVQKSMIFALVVQYLPKT